MRVHCIRRRREEKEIFSETAALSLSPHDLHSLDLRFFSPAVNSLLGPLAWLQMNRDQKRISMSFYLVQESETCDKLQQVSVNNEICFCSKGAVLLDSSCVSSGERECMDQSRFLGNESRLISHILDYKHRARSKQSCSI